MPSHLFSCLYSCYADTTDSSGGFIYCVRQAGLPDTINGIGLFPYVPQFLSLASVNPWPNSLRHAGDIDLWPIFLFSTLSMYSLLPQENTAP